MMFKVGDKVRFVKCTSLNPKVWGKSKVKWVQWDRFRKLWRVRIKGKYIGRYKSERDAIQAIKDNTC